MRKTGWILLLIWVLGATTSCHKGVPIDDIQRIPELSPLDTALANVYQVLDGDWEGEFIIYEDPEPGAKNSMDLNNLQADVFSSGRLQELSRIQVRQEYRSLNPYFQKVKIIDTYPEDQRQELSEGVNKVQDGKMWCVVHKPSETVIHRGRTRGANTILWQREERGPQRIEFFQETVAEAQYEIMGWGYYEGDDPAKTPRLWFYGKYKRP